jgi:hypothetical protein
MSVKIIRAHGTAHYSQNNKKVRIEFKDGSFMVGFININSKFIGNELQDDEPDTYQSIENSKFKFNRVSDYLKDCNQSEGVITIFNTIYGGHENKICFVFLHSVKFICEEPEEKIEIKEDPPPKKEEQPEERISLSLRDRIQKSK